MLSKEELIRYQKQISLPGFGTAAQLKLRQAKVLVVGAGGLGCPALQYLAAAGIGILGILDGDTVAESNLSRQVLYDSSEIGRSKPALLQNKLQQQNPHACIHSFAFALNYENAGILLPQYDLVLDCSDNFPTRYLINDYCAWLRKPVVFASVSAFEGQVAVFNCGNMQEEIPLNYRDLHPWPPEENCIRNCAENGVLGVVAGITGLMQANEAIKLLSGTGTVLKEQVLYYDALSGTSRVLRLPHNPHNPLRQWPDLQAFLEQHRDDYVMACGPLTEEITPQAFTALCASGEAIQLIDAREPEEYEAFTLPHALSVPFSSPGVAVGKIDPHKKTVAFCNSGTRSAQLIQALQQKYDFKNIFLNLQGGLNHYFN